MAPPHPHAGVNFVQPSAAQQYHNFEQMNTANPTHPSNNNRKKGKNRNNNNPGQGGNHPPQHQPPRGNQNQGNQNPQGGNNNKRNKGGILLKPSTLVLFVVCTVITPTIAPKSLISKG
jgi:hypothetical protein